MMRFSFRFGFVAMTVALIAFLSCHGSSKSGPTAPGMNPTPTIPVPGMTPTPAPMGAHMVAVGQGGNAFVDTQSGNSTTTVKAGTTVTWTWVGGTHSTTSGTCCTGDGTWDSGIMSSGSFSHTFNTPGNFPYFCMVHLNAMTGMVSVTP